MKIVQLLQGLPTALSNEELQFVEKYNDPVKITSLSERDQILARNLVRRGIFDVSKDNVTILNRTKANS